MTGPFTQPADQQRAHPGHDRGRHQLRRRHHQLLRHQHPTCANTGDDGLALWSSGAADSGDAFSHDTVELPILANNFAIYGGHDNTITEDYGTDTITQGGGIQVGNRFAMAVPLA